MNDQELLTYAAKAIDLKWLSYHHLKGLCCRDDNHGGLIEYYWNPLFNDADAFQLMVKLSYIHRMPLSLYLGVDSDGEQGYSSCEGSGVGKMHYHKENSIAEISSASRRAIVMAAAEIGKGM